MAKEQREKKGQAEQAPKSTEAPRHAAKETPRLKTRFLKEIAPVLLKENQLCQNCMTKWAWGGVGNQVTITPEAVAAHEQDASSASAA